MILFVVFSWLLCSCAYGGRVFDPNKAEIAPGTLKRWRARDVSLIGDRPLPDTSRDIGEALDLQQRNRVEQKMLECWTKPTGLFLYSDEACALAWKVHALAVSARKSHSFCTLPFSALVYCATRRD